MKNMKKIHNSGIYLIFNNYNNLFDNLNIFINLECYLVEIVKKQKNLRKKK